MAQTDPLDIAELIERTAPLTGAVEVREYSDTSWVFALEGDLLVSVDHDEARDILVLTANVGRPPSGGEAEAYALLLQVATMWRDTGGLRMGLDRPDGFVTQIYDLPKADLEPERLASSIARFAEIAGTWQVILKTAEARVTVDETFIRI